MNRDYQSENFKSFNRNMRRINYNNRDIHRELNEAMDSINRSILSLNSMGYDVYSDRNSLAATLRQPRSTPRHPGRFGSFNRPTIASSSNRNHNARQYVTSTKRSIDIHHWAESLLSATTGWNRAFAHLQLSPLTP